MSRGKGFGASFAEPGAGVTGVATAQTGLPRNSTSSSSSVDARDEY